MITPTAPDTMHVIGLFSRESGELTGVSFKAYFATREEAATFAARFPKSVRARSTGLSGAPGVTGIAEISLSFTPNKATGAKNDASISRYVAVMRALRRLGIRLVDGPQIYGNQLPDLSSIDRAVTELSKTPPAQLDREVAESWRHWRVKFTKRGMEPPRPFGKTSAVVCATSRREAIEQVGAEASPGYPVIASVVGEHERATFPHRCHHPTLIPGLETPAASVAAASPTRREIEDDVRRIRDPVVGKGPGSSGYRVAYLVPNPRRAEPGQETMLRLWYAGEGVLQTMIEATADLRAAKRRGYTAWIADAAGQHVPVEGARRPYPGSYSSGA